MKEIGDLQETASQSLLAGKGKSELIAGFVADGIDERTAERIVENAAQRVKRQGAGGEDADKPSRNAFNYSTITGALFLTAGVGSIAYLQVTGAGSDRQYTVAGVAIAFGVYRLVRGAL